MDMSSGEWLPDLANDDDPEAIIRHYCYMMMGSTKVNDQEEIDKIFQPSNEIYATNTPSINSSWSSSGQLISFGSSELETNVKPKYKKKELNNNGGKRVGGGLEKGKEHVIAERRRREKMTQGFLALSALIPGLKKMDKVSILADATEYLKQLEERAKCLEEQTTKRIVDSAYLVKNMQKCHSNPRNDANNSSSYSQCLFGNSIISDELLEIEVRMLNNNILIRVHSLKKQGLIQRIMEAIRKLSLTILNCQTIPFGSFAIDVTIIAQVSDDFGMTPEDLVKYIGKTLQHVNSQNH